MDRTWRTGPAARAAVLLVAVVALFGIGRMAALDLPQLGLSQAYAQDGPRARVEPVRLSGMDGGRVLVRDREVAVLAVPAGGLSGWERALIVADRINRSIEAGMRPGDIRVRTTSGVRVIQHGSLTLVSVLPDDARLVGEQPVALANKWAANLRGALGGTAEGPPADDDDDIWRPGEPYSDKFVPILSLLEGTRIGVARVNGPRSRVALTQAVAQFSIDFGNFLEIDIYVPISTRVPGRTIDRVQGVGVTGLGDLRL